MAGHVTSQVIRLASNLVLTRLLVPEMFGVMSIVYMINVGMSLLSDIGLQQNIIQSKRGTSPDFLNTVWSIQVIRGITLWLVAIVISAFFSLAGTSGWLPIDSAYAEPLLPSLIAVNSLALAISGFESTKAASAARELAQKRIALLELAAQIVAMLVMITWAYLDRSVWALVAGGLTGAVVRVFISHFLLPGIVNRWAWDNDSVKEAFHFGKWIFLSSVLGFLLNNGDRLLLGGLISAESLGIYSIAYLMLSAIQGAISKLVAGVGYPALSEVYRENNQKLKRTYYKLRSRIDIVVLFISGLLFMSGEAIVRLLYDDRYITSGRMLEVLSLVLVAERFSLLDFCYLTIGKPILLTIKIAFQLVVLYIAILVGFHTYGVDGAIWGIVLTSFTVIGFDLFMSQRISILDLRREAIVLPMFAIGMFGGWLLQVTLFSVIGLK